VKPFPSFARANEESSMILSDQDISTAIADGSIVIEPFRENSLGSNSYDVHLGATLAVYRDAILDARRHNEIEFITIPEDGIILYPNEFYLGVTEEYTESHQHVPFLEGKSSVGRLGIDIHATAGKGDVGFCNTWTLEISVKKPVRVYRGMPIGQIIYFKVSGEVVTPYSQKKSAKYATRSSVPVESMMYKNF
jgi:dCTP deaminase